MQESSAARTGGAGVVAHAPHPHALPFYTVPDDALEMGASLGNSALWVNTKGAGAVERVFCVELGQSLLNMIAIRRAGKLRDPPRLPTALLPHRRLCAGDGDDVCAADRR